mmetsp:Transcript_19217/g.30955  ORF Transcript_19217/g.30955 Transcript_19217/m.30955 type:complete len:112 (+) Transcript_19217:200-535(+)
MRIEVVVQHRESWQQVGTVLDSKGNLMSYCTEVQKMLGIQYKAPHVPIELTMDDSNNNNNTSVKDQFLAGGNYAVSSNADHGEDSLIQERSEQSQSEVFRSLAQAKHNIRV